MSVLSDERGQPSAARRLLVVTMIFLALVIVVDAASTWFAVPDPAWGGLGSLVMGLCAWTAGPRISQHIGPQIGAVASGIAAARKEPRRPKLLDNDPAFSDDEK